MQEVYAKQLELMEKVPHEIRHDVYPRANIVLDIIRYVIVYYNSLGGKPWRPNPLPEDAQLEKLQDVVYAVGRLITQHNSPASAVPGPESRLLVSTLGMIEESIEHFRATDESNRLEEITDILFFYTEALIHDGYTFDQVIAEYNRKWQINMNRYAAAKANDYSWDKRREKGSQL